MTDCKFAQDQLAKYGWVSGAGLGKDEQGIKSHIKVSIKNNKKGVGHDPSKEFTNNWWDQMFNNAAKSITVNNTESGVDVKKVIKESEKKAKKTVLYGNFIKTSTLTNTEDGCSEEVRHEEEELSEEEDVINSKKYTVTDEEMFAKCGGRTAHKGARHGLKLNGKLKRIEEHEAILLKQMKEKIKSDNEKKNKNKESVSDCDQIDSNMCDTGENLDNCGTKKKKKKKKSKSSEDDIETVINESDTNDVCVKKKKRKSKEEEIETIISDSVTDDVKKKKKSKKRKREKEMSESYQVEDNNCDQVDDIQVSKKKKKKKKDL